MVLQISIRADVKAIQKKLSDLERRQLPFATATALTALARRVQKAETGALTTTFDRPTPFTMRAFGVQPARKSNLVATVFARDRQAHYLLPYEFGGTQVLNRNRGILKPKNVPLNVYGNLPRGKLARLKARKDVFIGTVHGIHGVWQRPARGPRRRGGYGTKGAHSAGLGFRTTLRLLIRFADPVEVHQRLDFRARAEKIVRSFFTLEFNATMRQALATAK